MRKRNFINLFSQAQLPYPFSLHYITLPYFSFFHLFFSARGDFLRIPPRRRLGGLGAAGEKFLFFDFRLIFYEFARFRATGVGQQRFLTE